MSDTPQTDAYYAKYSAWLRDKYLRSSETIEQSPEDFARTLERRCGRLEEALAEALRAYEGRDAKLSDCQMELAEAQRERDELKHDIARHVEIAATATNEALERAAQWYADEGWKLDEDAVPAAIRALKEDATPRQPNEWPTPPEFLVDALQDRLPTEERPSRIAHATRENATKEKGE